MEGGGDDDNDDDVKITSCAILPIILQSSKN